MANTPKNFSKLFYASLVSLVLLACAGTFIFYVNQFRTEVERTFESRSALLTKMVDMHRNQVSVMKNLMVERYSANTADNNDFKFRTLPEKNVWELVAPDAQTLGTLTGAGTLPPSKDMQKEMLAALGMEAQIQAAQQFDKEVVWLYYVSENGFVYLAPKPGDSFHFTPSLYERPYWLEAGPQANKTQRMILAGPLQDLAGKGSILTFADPVYASGRFLGVVALDIRIDTLNKLTGFGSALGESMMISENDRLITKQIDSAPQASVHPPLSNKLLDWREDESTDLWLSSPIVKEELWLAHRLKQSQLYAAAALESLPIWCMIILLALLGVFAQRLRRALVEVTRMTQIDPLTQALNRRGFYEKSVATFAISKRKNLAIAVMIMDIDFFKKVNDNYGHPVGDSVLQQLGGYLLNASRPFDLVCRWGGEEFVLILLVDRADEAQTIAERMRQEANRTRIQPGNNEITVSSGSVILKQDESIDDAVKRADLLLYQAKTSGRNRLVFEV